MKAPLTLGIAGLGTVGAGLVRLLAEHRERLAAMLGREITIVAVSGRDRNKARGCDVSKFHWFDDPVKLATAPGIDCFVELIGGDEGVAREAVLAALESGKHVVTANKALLAKHGVALAALAEEKGVALNFEAAVAGGIPVIKTLRESLLANSVNRVYGILNGTCNFILTKMQEEGRPFADVLAEAQALGYAEADPTFDVGGFDTAHKLAILTSLAFGTKVALEEIYVEGIENITEGDINAAEDLGYRIKLLGVAVRTGTGIEARVHPAMVPQDEEISEVWGVTNCVAIEGDRVGNLLLTGPGAGGDATASAVASDIVDIARGIVVPPFVTPVRLLKPHTRAKLGEHKGAYYVRLSVHDKPGAMAAITMRMAEQGVSLESIVQRRPKGALPGAPVVTAPGTPAAVTLITHTTTEQAIRTALDAIEADGKVAERPQLIRIEEL
ncbi:MAG: homoserine dehydrogenase [Hyphomicrobiaceae bacterium]|nr:homoserine dehydrogenase [Hyphomicrobiaceae bacterium]